MIYDKYETIVTKSPGVYALGFLGILMPIQKLLEESGLPLYVLTNREKVYGASAMFYSDKMKELADGLGSLYDH